MTVHARYYNVDDFVTKKRQQTSEAKAPPRANFLAAADHIKSLFEAKKFTYGFTGGFEMLCLGHHRDMPDLQIAYDDKDFHRIKAKLEADRRMQLPEGMNSLFPAKVLVRTGPSYKDEGCTEVADVEVDLIPPGSHGAPSMNGLLDALVLLSLRTDGKVKRYKGLNMLYLVETLIYYCRLRELAWEPQKDILFLCQHYGEEIRAIRNQLDKNGVQLHFLGTSTFSLFSPEDQRRCYGVLMGTEPPPRIEISSTVQSCSGHRASASEDANRPRMPTYKSSPAIITQRTSFLSPCLPGASKACQWVSSEVQLANLPCPNTQPQTLSESSKVVKDSRSRYRPVSAPHSRGVSSLNTSFSKPDSMHTRQVSQPSTVSVGSYTPGSHRGQSNHELQLPVFLAPGPVPGQNHRSMPGLGSAFKAQSRRVPCLKPPLMQPPRHAYMEFNRSAISAPLNPGQHHLKSQLGLAGNFTHQLRVSYMPITEPITEQPTRPPPRNAPQTRPSAREQLSTTPVSLIPSSRQTLMHEDSYAVQNSQPTPALQHTAGQGVRLDVQTHHPPSPTCSPPVDPPTPALDPPSPSTPLIAELSTEPTTPLSNSPTAQHHGRPPTVHAPAPNHPAEPPPPLFHPASTPHTSPLPSILVLGVYPPPVRAAAPRYYAALAAPASSRCGDELECTPVAPRGPSVAVREAQGEKRLVGAEELARAYRAVMVMESGYGG